MSTRLRFNITRLSHQSRRALNIRHLDDSINRLLLTSYNFFPNQLHRTSLNLLKLTNGI